MPDNSITPSIEPQQEHKLSPDFWKLWVGQAISALGGSFTGFALPLIVYKLTNSALNLAFATAAYFIPYLLFGLFVGAWADRVDRRRLMILADLGRAVAIASIPVLAMLGFLEVWWIYVVIFINSVTGIAFDAANFAAVPSLVSRGDLVTANGRIQASYSVMTLLGPLLAGAVVAILPIYDLLLIDSASFVVSAFMLFLINAGFNAPGKTRGKSIRQDVIEGLRYVFGHPVLRNISLMMALVNFANTTVYAQRVLYATQQLGATDSQIAFLSASSSVGIVLLSLLAGRLRKKLPFSKVALGALITVGFTIIALSFTRNYWVALPIFALFSGLGIMFNINTNSLRQAIAPNHMLGRVTTIAGVLAWSANPLGAFIGGLAIERTQNVSLVFAVIGIITIIIPIIFFFTPLGHAEDYLPKNDVPSAEHPQLTQEAPEGNPGVREKVSAR